MPRYFNITFWLLNVDTVFGINPWKIDTILLLLFEISAKETNKKTTTTTTDRQTKNRYTVKLKFSVKRRWLLLAIRTSVGNHNVGNIFTLRLPTGVLIPILINDTDNYYRPYIFQTTSRVFTLRSVRLLVIINRTQFLKIKIKIVFW